MQQDAAREVGTCRHVHVRILQERDDFPHLLDSLGNADDVVEGGVGDCETVDVVIIVSSERLADGAAVHQPVQTAEDDAELDDDEHDVAQEAPDCRRLVEIVLHVLAVEDERLDRVGAFLDARLELRLAVDRLIELAADRAVARRDVKLGHVLVAELLDELVRVDVDGLKERGEQHEARHDDADDSDWDSP